VAENSSAFADVMARLEVGDQAAACRPKLCEAHFLLGLRRLSEGNRGGALGHFQKSIDTRSFIYWDHKWARNFRDRLKKDPTWPQWIPRDEGNPKGSVAPPRGPRRLPGRTSPT
jgi:hypothetical protein